MNTMEAYQTLIINYPGTFVVRLYFTFLKEGIPEAGWGRGCGQRSLKF